MDIIKKVNFYEANLINEKPANIINIAGWIYFAVSLLGGITLLASASTKQYILLGYVDTTNYAYLCLGIAGIVSSFIVLLICSGISLIIKQNAYLISIKIEGKYSEAAASKEIKNDDRVKSF
jgi:hypothetical protein